jgi:dihydropteroate synthase
MMTNGAQVQGSSAQEGAAGGSPRASHLALDPGHWALDPGHSALTTGRWELRRGALDLDRPVVMGILNVTPDSFSDGGRFFDPADAVAQAWRMAAAGADIVNDVSGLADAEMASVVAPSGAGLVLMHMRGTPETMQRLTDYGDVVDDVAAELAESLARADAAGIARERVVLDPGIGFAKTAEQNLELIASLERMQARLGRPLLLGPSRKSFIGALLGGVPAEARDAGTTGACVAGLARGARLFRVHDVRAARQALDVAWAVLRIPARAP